MVPKAKSIYYIYCRNNLKLSSNQKCAADASKYIFSTKRESCLGFPFFSNCRKKLVGFTKLNLCFVLL